MTKFDWNKIRARIKLKFEKAGITTCELRLPGCTYGNFLTFAHSKKVRHWETLEDAEDVILACQKCHGFIEALGQRNLFTMKEIHDRVKQRRITAI